MLVYNCGPVVQERTTKCTRRCTITLKGEAHMGFWFKKRKTHATITAALTKIIGELDDVVVRNAEEAAELAEQMNHLNQRINLLDVDANNCASTAEKLSEILKIPATKEIE